MLVLGNTNHEIADALVVSVKTVENPPRPHHAQAQGRLAGRAGPAGLGGRAARPRLTPAQAGGAGRTSPMSLSRTPLAISSNSTRIALVTQYSQIAWIRYSSR